jgi:hypothetical protein
MRMHGSLSRETEKLLKLKGPVSLRSINRTDRVIKGNGYRPFTTGGILQGFNPAFRVSAELDLLLIHDRH